MSHPLFVFRAVGLEAVWLLKILRGCSAAERCSGTGQLMKPRSMRHRQLNIIVSTMSIATAGVEAPNGQPTCARYPVKHQLPHPIGCSAPNATVETQLVDVFQRVLRFDEGTGRVVEPVVEPGQQEAQRAAAGKEGERGQFRR